MPDVSLKRRPKMVNWRKLCIQMVKVCANDSRDSIRNSKSSVLTSVRGVRGSGCRLY